MAINPETQYPGKITPASEAFPYGSARNVTVPGDGTGTPWEAALLNDIFGFQQALLSGAGIVPTGNPDEVGASQYLDAIKAIIGSRTYATVAAMVADDSLIDGSRVLTFDSSRFETWVVAVTGDVLLDNGRFATRTQSRIYTTLAELKADASLKAGENLFAFFAGDEVAKNSRQLYRIQDLAAVVVSNTVADDVSIIALSNGLFAVAVQSVNDGNVPFYMMRSDMHFMALKGTPWNQAEAGGSPTFLTTVQAIASSLTLTLNSVTNLVPNQLICYEADNGQFYSTVIESIASTTLTLRNPIESVISIGGKVHNFYVNNSHANLYGFYTIFDYALRANNAPADKRALQSLTKVAELRDGDWKILTAGGETVTSSSEEVISAPGSTNNPYTKVATTGAQQGAISDGKFELPEGQYRIKAYINPGAQGVNPNNVELAVLETYTPTLSVAQVADSFAIGEDACTVLELDYYARANSTQEIILRCSLAGVAEFEIGLVEIHRVSGNITNLNTGKHVLFGDSWINFGELPDRARDRLPNATFFEEGVGGNTAAALLARFDTDVAPHKPDFVWVMCGTNDYFGDRSLDAFDRDMNAIKAKISALGAIPLIFDPSVGEIDNLAEPQNFDRSRTYALKGSYTPSESLLPLIGPSTQRLTQSINNVTLAGGTKVVIMSCPGTTTQGYTIRKSQFNSSGMNINAGLATNLSGPTEQIVTYNAGTTIPTPSSPQIILNPLNDSRIASVELENTTGGTLTVNGFIEIDWEPTNP